MACAENMKVYLHKATQTEPFLVLPAGCDPFSQSNIGASDILDLTMKLSVAHGKTAYINPEVQAPDTVPGNIPLRSSISQRQSYAQLHFNRPSKFGSSTKRVVSLPEDYVGNVGFEEPHQRVVSMPERLQSLSSDTSGSFSSADISSISLGSNVPDLTSPLCRNHAYPSALPSTPSPPSSPESIMIIGHNSQVPRTLRSKCAYNQTYGDNGGWISWANSPPRPIPALHGPLSLPYARCPSGAEGTIIEGEDLTNMIWGLNADEAQSRSQGPANICQKSQNIPPRLQRSPKPNNCALPNVGTIDLSQLAVPRYPNVNGVSAGQSFTMNQPETIAHGRPQYPQLRLTRLPGNEEIRAPDWRRGLGLSWQDSVELPPPKSRVFYQDRGYNTLKASAPPFVPSGAPASCAASHFVVEPYISDFVQNIAWPSHQDQARDYLPTPPSSSSPLWSPHVSTPSAIVMTSPRLSLHDLPEDKQLLLSQLLSPSIQARDHMQDFNCWLVERSESGAKVKMATLDSASTFPAQSTDVRSSDNLIKRESFLSTQNLTNAYTNLTSDPSAPDTSSLLRQSNDKTVPASPERHFRGISQQPRSIPLARLIQRRLSSVAEEDINALTEEDSTSLNSRLPCPASASQNIQVMKTAQLESISSAHQTTKRTPSPSTNNLEPRTSQEHIHTTAPAPNQANAKVVVRLPSINTSSIQVVKVAHSEEKENSKIHGQAIISSTGTMTKKKIRNRRKSRSSSAQG